MERGRDYLTTVEIEQLDTLKAIAGIEDDGTAIRYLEMAAWNVEQAMNLYLDYGSNSTGNNANNNAPPMNDQYAGFDPRDVPDLNAPPEYQPYQNDLQGGFNDMNANHGYHNFPMQPQAPQEPMPEFTPEQMNFYNATTNKDKGLGGMLTDGFKSIASS